MSAAIGHWSTSLTTLHGRNGRDLWGIISLNKKFSWISLNLSLCCNYANDRRRIKTPDNAATALATKPNSYAEYPTIHKKTCIDRHIDAFQQKNYSIGFKSSATLKGASVLLLISSTVTPSAISMRVRPLAKSTSKTPCESLVKCASTKGLYKRVEFAYEFSNDS